MLQFKLVCIVLHVCLIMVIFKEAELYGEIRFPSQQLTFTFNDSLFLRFFDCMLHQYKSCTVITDYIDWSTYEVVDILHSDDIVKKPEPYTCYWYFISPDIYGAQCVSQEQIRCTHYYTSCTSSYIVLVLKTENFVLYGDSIASCYNGCSDQAFYYRVITTTTLTTLRTTTTRTTKSTLRTILSSSTLPTTQSTNATYFLLSSTIKTFHENSSVNVSGITSNKETGDNTSETIIISACVVSVVCLVIVSILGILFWRRHRTNLTNNCNVTKLENRDVNSKNALNSPCSGGNEKMPYRSKTSVEPPDLLKTGHKHTVKIYSNCVVEGEYTSIGEEENNSAISTSLDHKRHVGTFNDGETNSDILSNTKCDYKTDKSNENTIQDTSVENNQTNNAVYINTADKPSSEYQRLGQERRDLKNPYQQLLQVEQEQQVVLSDQELSPYTLAKPVLGETTLQVIDVGAWVNNSSDTEMTKEDQPYNNTIKNVFTPHEPTVYIKHDSLDYTMVMHKQ